MKRIITSVAVRVILAAVFAALIAAMKWEYFQWGLFKIRFVNTLFYPASIIFVVVLLFSALLHPLRELYRNGRIPFFQAATSRLIAGLHGLFSKLSFQFAFWGLIMSLLMVFAWDLGLLRDKEYRFNQTVLPWIGIGESKENPPVVLFNYLSQDNNQRTYLQNCAKMARDLKEAGARVVLIPLPSIFSPESKELVEKIHKTGIVVFGVRNELDYFLAQARTEAGVRTGRLSMDIYERHPFRLTFVQQIDPFPYHKYSLWQNAHDVVFEILRLYYNLPPGEPVMRKGDHLVFGNLRYPVDENGMMNVGSFSLCYFGARVNAGYGFDWWGSKEKGKKAKLEYVYAGKFEATDNLAQYREMFGGKIVILQWHDLGGISPPIAFGESRDYAQVVGNILRGNVLTQSNSGSLLIGLVSILGCGLILYRSRLVSAVALLVLFSFVILYGSAWLFQEMKILVDIPVAIASLIVSISVFTVLRLGYEWRFGTSRGFSASAAATTGRPVVAAPSTSGILGLSRRKISISPAVAIGVLLLVVAASVAAVRGLGGKGSGQPEKETVYVTSLPTVEVRGVYIPTKETKQ